MQEAGASVAVRDVSLTYCDGNSLLASCFVFVKAAGAFHVIQQELKPLSNSGERNARLLQD